MIEAIRPILVIAAFISILAEFRAEVHGKATVWGCAIRYADGVDDGQCGAAAPNQ